MLTIRPEQPAIIVEPLREDLVRKMADHLRTHHGEEPKTYRWQLIGRDGPYANVRYAVYASGLQVLVRDEQRGGPFTA
jgi:hypothetical protein